MNEIVFYAAVVAGTMYTIGHLTGSTMTYIKKRRFDKHTNVALNIANSK